MKKLSKNEILEIKKAYQAMASDYEYQKEMCEMAEMGMADYWEIIKND